jgi:hypothetical protein
MKRSVVWDTMPCSPLKIDQHFIGTFCLHLQAQGISQARNWLKVAIFWDIALCGPYMWTSILGECKTSIFRVENQPSKKPAYSHTSMLVSCLADFWPWRWRFYIPLKCWFICRLHSTVPQMMARCKMQDIDYSSRKLIGSQGITWHYIHWIERFNAI